MLGHLSPVHPHMRGGTKTGMLPGSPPHAGTADSFEPPRSIAVHMRGEDASAQFPSVHPHMRGEDSKQSFAFF